MVKNRLSNVKGKEFHLDLTVPIPPNCCCGCLERLSIESLRFLLFQRQQIPEPYQLLNRQYSKGDRKERATAENSAKSRCESRNEKQIFGLLESLKSSEDLMKSAFSAGSVEEIHFCIGPTPISPREIYCLRFSNFDSDDSPATVSQQVEELCRRKLCSALFARDEYFLTSCQTSTVHIFAFATSGSLGKGWMPWPQYKVNPKKVQLILTFHPDAQQSKDIEHNKENISLSASNGRLPVTKDTVPNSTANNLTSNIEPDSAVPVNVCHKREANLKCENDTVHTDGSEITSGDLKQELTAIDKSQGVGEASNSAEDLLSKQLDESLNLKCDSAIPRVWYKAVVSVKGVKY